MSGMAQTLTILEGLIGRFYLISFMASLVGLYIYRRQYHHPENKNEDRRSKAHPIYEYLCFLIMCNKYSRLYSRYSC